MPPSPKVQAYDATLPSESVLPEPLNEQAPVASQFEPNTACGLWLPAAAGLRAIDHMTALSLAVFVVAVRPL